MPTFLELNLFTLLLFLAVALAVWFVVACEISSTRRMKCMMAEMGLEYDMATSADPATEAIIAQARTACLRCRSEGLCERWLDMGKKDERFIALLAQAVGPVKVGGAAGAVTGAARAIIGETGETITRAEDFCPNAAAFRRLARVSQPNGPLQAEPPKNKARNPA